MALVRKTITLTAQQNSWIKAQIESCQYTNESEFIRDLIRKEQERAVQVEDLRKALIEGENSGEQQPFDAAAFKQCMFTNR
jgi:antitoxin ParD1/3/4